MGNLNQVTLLGRLGADPDKKITKDGTSVLNISLATEEKFKDKTGNWQKRTSWHRLTIWGRCADIVAEYCHKGSQLLAVGSIQYGEYTDKDGNKRHTTEINVSSVQLVDPPDKNQQQPQQRGQQYEPHPSQVHDDQLDDDIPF